MTRKKKWPHGRDRGVPVPTSGVVLRTLADMLDRMTVREVVTFVDALRRRAGRGRKTHG